MPSRVMLMSMDTLRADAIGLNPFRESISRFNVDSRSDTPTLDALCEAGTFFTNCQVQAPYTTSSHGSMLTGCWPCNHGIREYFLTPLHDDVQTLFDQFKRAGYVTILATDFPTLLGPILGFTRNVDHYLDEDDDALFELLRTLSDRNVFCFWHLADAHMPYGMSSIKKDGRHFMDEARRVMGLAGIEATKSASNDWLLESNRPDEERVLRLGYYDATERLHADGKHDLLMDLYLRGVERFDRTRLSCAVASLKSLRWCDDGIIAITGDHGEEHSDRGYEHFDSIWNGVTTVPLVLIGPDLPAGRIDNEMVRSIDIAPTLLHLASVDAIEGMDGISLVPRLHNQVPLGLVSLCEAWFGDFVESGKFLNACHAAGKLLEVPSLADRHLVSARDGRWKCMVHRNLRDGSEDRFLFDCHSDVNETRDVKDRFPRAAESLSKELEPLLAAETRTRPRKGGIVTTDIASGLINMGYLRR